MLELRDVTLFIEQGEEVRPLLADITLRLPRAHFCAVIGPSGCGKSTLLKVISGIADGDEEGAVRWDNRDLSVDDFSPSEIGFVPQFSIAYEELTVRECVSYAMKLRVKGLQESALNERVELILDEVNMIEFADRFVRVLSGGQRRRLALAMELVSKPLLLLCDEVTSGLDPQSEDEIVKLLHSLSRLDGRLVLSVTHSLRHLSSYDSVLVLYQGIVAYHGPSEFLAHYFRCDDPQDLYSQLELRDAKEWSQSWKKHQAAFRGDLPDINIESIEEIVVDEAGDLVEVRETVIESVDAEAEENAKAEEEPDAAPEIVESDLAPVDPTPGFLSQFWTLTKRRFRIFSRNKAQIFLQLGLIFGFPILVAIFAWNGLPSVKNLSMDMNLGVVQQLIEGKEYLIQASKIGSLVSGIVMFQVILLTLMGANNSGREIAAERLIFEKEKLSGLNPLSYIGSKAVFLLSLVLAQSLWMGLFVHFVCGFPGDIFAQLLFLLLVNAAMTFVCLAISSLMGSAEQASLVSIYLVGFQLPLSGAVLALPDWAGTLARPFISAYWSWSGILQTLREERYYDIVQTVIQTALSPSSLCLWVLCSHIIIGFFITYIGCQRSRMG